MVIFTVSLAEAVMSCVWSVKNDKDRSVLKCHWSNLLSLTVAL